MIDDLLSRVKDAEDAALEDPGPRERAEERLLAHARTRAVPREPRRSLRGAGVAALAAAALVLAALLGRATVAVPRAAAPPEAIRYELSGGVPSVGSYVEARERALLRFSEGSEVALDGGARARVTALRPSGADVALETGALHASIVHRSGTDWRVHAGPFAIVVVGTEFDATWDERAGSLAVAVREGAVRVEGRCMAEAARVTAGEAQTFACAGWVEAPRAGERTAAIEPHPVAPEPTPSAPTPRAPSAAVTPAPAPTDDVAATLEAAQRAVLAGDPFAAEALLREVRDRAPGTDDAALAAFLLGRVAFDEQRAYPAAAEWFARYLTERPEGRLAREAMGRQLEALDRAGDGAGARALATRYLERFPEGPHAAHAARILGAPE